MSKLNYCLNGKTVTEQVIRYQQDRRDEDFLMIQLYDDNFKTIWYQQLEDYMDRATFDSEFDYRLVRAVNSFNADAANKNAKRKGLSVIGNFNRWFYKILTNWKSNVKTSSIRLKKRPAIQCPVCGRFVGRIDEEHLAHKRTLRDLPGFMSWNDKIYEVARRPAIYTVCWGEYNPDKLSDLEDGNCKDYVHDKHRARWPWRLKDGVRGVLCPFTKQVVAELNERYLEDLPAEYRSYAPAMTWQQFIRAHPKTLIQSEIYSLDYVTNKLKSKALLQDHVPVSKTGFMFTPDATDIDLGVIPIEYEHVFSVIDLYTKDTAERKILKLLASGYELNDIAEETGLDGKEVRKIVRSIKHRNGDLKSMLNFESRIRGKYND